MESGYRQLTTQEITALSYTKQEQLGALGMTSDGRAYRYVNFSGAQTWQPGQIITALAVNAALSGLAISAIGSNGQVLSNLQAGSTQIILIASGTGAVSADQFSEGYIEILQAGTPLSYKVKGNTAAAVNQPFTVFLDSREPLRNVATLTPGTDTANVTIHPCSVVRAQTAQQLVIGVAVVAVPPAPAGFSQFGWVQIGGHCLIANDAVGALTVGVGIAQSTTVAGAMTAAGATSYDIGQAKAAIASGAVGPVRLNIN